MLPREITQYELRHNTCEIMRALDRGESFVLMCNGVPIATLTPLPEQMFSKASAVLEAFSKAPPVDYARFRADVDRYVDQNHEPPA